MNTVMGKYDFAQVYADHKELVWKLVCRYAAAPPDREDLFQEVFFKIHRALPRFRGESKLETWIYRLTVNTAINYLKKQRRYEQLKRVLEGLGLLRVEAPVPEDGGAVWKPLKKLNPKQRAILVMADIEEKKLEEISRILDIPLGTVKSNLNRAREIVKKELNKNEGI